jgi:antitoxin ParD1/3/4
MPSSYAVGEHFEQFIKQQVEGGRYASASEVVRDALRLLEEEQQRREATLEALRTEVKKGLASGKGKPAEEVLGRLERKYADMAKSQHKK